MIQILLWAPLAAGLLACVMPQRLVPLPPLLTAVTRLGLVIYVVARFNPSLGLQHTVDESWIPALGVRYQLGVDGISLFLAVLTSVLWLATTIWSTINPHERPRTWFLMLGIAETATLGAFLAQDLILFVLFFDLMLIPFYFLFGAWGTEHPGRPEEDEGPIRPQAAVIKMIVYTLVGSLLMLAGAIATGILTANGGPIDFNIQHLAANPLGSGSQYWIFWFFAAAFLVKMPAFPLHAWMPDAYRVAPLPALALFSGVLSKVGAYGFLRIVLPVFPAATTHFQEVILVIAVASILYGSVMAFTQTSARLILGYSSVAQLGFITLGIFSLRPDGADGAVLQMVNHGLVVAPADADRRSCWSPGPAATTSPRWAAWRCGRRCSPRSSWSRRWPCSPSPDPPTSWASSTSSTGSSRRRSSTPSSPRSGSRCPPTTRSASTSTRCTTASRTGSSRARSACSTAA